MNTLLKNPVFAAALSSTISTDGHTSGTQKQHQSSYHSHPLPARTVNTAHSSVYSSPPWSSTTWTTDKGALSVRNCQVHADAGVSSVCPQKPHFVPSYTFIQSPRAPRASLFLTRPASTATRANNGPYVTTTTTGSDFRISTTPRPDSCMVTTTNSVPHISPTAKCDFPLLTTINSNPYTSTTLNSDCRISRASSKSAVESSRNFYPSSAAITTVTAFKTEALALHVSARTNQVRNAGGFFNSTMSCTAQHPNNISSPSSFTSYLPLKPFSYFPSKYPLCPTQSLYFTNVGGPALTTPLVAVTQNYFCPLRSRFPWSSLPWNASAEGMARLSSANVAGCCPVVLPSENPQLAHQRESKKKPPAANPETGKVTASCNNPSRSSTVTAYELSAPCFKTVFRQNVGVGNLAVGPSQTKEAVTLMTAKEGEAPAAWGRPDLTTDFFKATAESLLLPLHSCVFNCGVVCTREEYIVATNLAAPTVATDDTTSLEVEKVADITSHENSMGQVETRMTPRGSRTVDVVAYPETYATPPVVAECKVNTRMTSQTHGPKTENVKRKIPSVDTESEDNAETAQEHNADDDDDERRGTAEIGTKEEKVLSKNPAVKPFREAGGPGTLTHFLRGYDRTANGGGGGEWGAGGKNEGQEEVIFTGNGDALFFPAFPVHRCRGISVWDVQTNERMCFGKFEETGGLLLLTPDILAKLALSFRTPFFDGIVLRAFVGPPGGGSGANTSVSSSKNTNSHPHHQQSHRTHSRKHSGAAAEGGAAVPSTQYTRDDASNRRPPRSSSYYDDGSSRRVRHSSRTSDGVHGVDADSSIRRDKRVTTSDFSHSPASSVSAVASDTNEMQTGAGRRSDVARQRDRQKSLINSQKHEDSLSENEGQTTTVGAPFSEEKRSTPSAVSGREEKFERDAFLSPNRQARIDVRKTRQQDETHLPSKAGIESFRNSRHRSVDNSSSNSVPEDHSNDDSRKDHNDDGHVVDGEKHQRPQPFAAASADTYRVGGQQRGTTDATTSLRTTEGALSQANKTSRSNGTFTLGPAAEGNHDISASREGEGNHNGKIRYEQGLQEREGESSRRNRYEEGLKERGGRGRSKPQYEEGLQERGGRHRSKHRYDVGLQEREGCGCGTHLDEQERDRGSRRRGNGHEEGVQQRRVNNDSSRKVTKETAGTSTGNPNAGQDMETHLTDHKARERESKRRKERRHSLSEKNGGNGGTRRSDPAGATPAAGASPPAAIAPPAAAAPPPNKSRPDGAGGTVRALEGVLIDPEELLSAIETRQQQQHFHASVDGQWLQFERPRRHTEYKLCIGESYWMAMKIPLEACNPFLLGRNDVVVDLIEPHQQQQQSREAEASPAASPAASSPHGRHSSASPGVDTTRPTTTTTGEHGHRPQHLNKHDSAAPAAERGVPGPIRTGATGAQTPEGDWTNSSSISNSTPLAPQTGGDGSDDVPQQRPRSLIAWIGIRVYDRMNRIAESAPAGVTNALNRFSDSLPTTPEEAEDLGKKWSEQSVRAAKAVSASTKLLMRSFKHAASELWAFITEGKNGSSSSAGGGAPS